VVLTLLARVVAVPLACGLVAASCSSSDPDGDAGAVTGSSQTVSAATASAPTVSAAATPSTGGTTPAQPPTTTPAGTTPAGTTPAIPVDPPLDAAGAPLPPRSPAELASRLAAVEGALAGDEDPATGTLGQLGHEQQVLYRTLVAHPEWLDAVEATLGPAAASRARQIVAAGSASSSSVGQPLESIPAWTIAAPAPPSELLGYYAEAELTSGVPWSLLAAINLVETRMGRIIGDSSAGAQGPMQFLPSTWEVFGEGGDITDERDAILAAARFLASTGAPADLAGAVRRYNPSDVYVAAVLGYHEVMAAEPWTYRGFWGWQVYVSTVAGLLWLPEGFATSEPLAASDYRP